VSSNNIEQFLIAREFSSTALAPLPLFCILRYLPAIALMIVEIARTSVEFAPFQCTRKFRLFQPQSPLPEGLSGALPTASYSNQRAAWDEDGKANRSGTVSRILQEIEGRQHR